MGIRLNVAEREWLEYLGQGNVTAGSDDPTDVFVLGRLAELGLVREVEHRGYSGCRYRITAAGLDWLGD